MNKEAIRTDMRAKRRSLTPSDVNTLSAQITEKLFSLQDIQSAKAVCTFISAFKEPDTLRITDMLIKNGKRVAVPITDTERISLSLSYIDGTHKLTRGAYGIYEPSVIKNANIEDIDAVLVPGLAFDHRGGRMGFGMGYYDRLLEGCKCVKIGLCYDFQILSEIPSEPHDVSMDYIITENEIIKAG